jgi:hypothetical protein
MAGPEGLLGQRDGRGLPRAADLALRDGERGDQRGADDEHDAGLDRAAARGETAAGHQRTGAGADPDPGAGAQVPPPGGRCGHALT